MGESQSAARMVTYIDVQPFAGIYDGFLVHGRGATSAPLGYLAPGPSSRPTGPPSGMPAAVKIRTDLHVPVITLETETDVEHFGFLPAAQPDSKFFRLWKAAGTAQADAYDTGVGFNEVGNGEAETALLNPAQIDNRDLKCAVPINSGLNFAFAEAAVWHLDRWVRDGNAAPRVPRLTVAGGPFPSIARGSHGNAKGGIRTPIIDMPIATYTRDPNSPGVNRELEGTTVHLSAATLGSLYPTRGLYGQVRRGDAKSRQCRIPTSMGGVEPEERCGVAAQRGKGRCSCAPRETAWATHQVKSKEPDSSLRAQIESPVAR